ncbi:MAG: carboxypeptidase-like regulatory domain-containing protein [Pyrinomonadaceae bacterium]
MLKIAYNFSVRRKYIVNFYSNSIAILLLITRIKERKKMKKNFVLMILTFLLSATFIFAQDTTGRIIGTVSAADGVIPGATIVVRDNQTGREQTVTASSEGTFTVSQLEFGTYTVTVTATGYKTLTANELKIDAGREYPLNAVLEVGAVTEQVTVTAGAEQINASNAELSNTISQQQIRELPLNGRNPLALLNTVAGANRTTDSINGQRSSSTDYRRDGLNVQDNFIRTGGFVQDQPTVDDTSEVTVTTQNAGVEQEAVLVLFSSSRRAEVRLFMAHYMLLTVTPSSLLIRFSITNQLLKDRF